MSQTVFDFVWTLKKTEYVSGNIYYKSKLIHICMSLNNNIFAHV